MSPGAMRDQAYEQWQKACDAQARALETSIKITFWIIGIGGLAFLGGLAIWRSGLLTWGDR